MSKRHSSVGSPKIRLLAAALSLALPAAQANAADSGLKGNHSLQKPPSLDVSRLHATLSSYAPHGPTSSASPRAPMTRAVTTLADAGSGSLREALASAVDGDVIDLSQLHGRLLLSAPLEPTAAVTITGPGRDRLTLDGGGHGRVMQSAHSLTLSKVTVANGAVTPAIPTTPYGGCLLVSGVLALQNATVTNCHAVGSGTSYALGGAIAVVGSPGTALLKYDTISNSSATSTTEAVGGGVVAQYAVVADSTITGNSAVQTNGTTTTNIAAGGGVVGLYSGGTNPAVYAVYSNISGNSVSASGGSYYDPSTMTTSPQYGVAAGGGVFANGAYLGGSTINGNTLTANGFALGGGAIAGDNFVVSLTSVSQNSVSSSLNLAAGGGLLNAGTLTVTQSAITANQVSSTCGTCMISGGGIASYSNGGLSVMASTISGNSLTTTGAAAHPAGGGIGVKYSGSPPSSAAVTNSTISGNTLTGAYAGQSNGAGIWVGGNLTLDNSTVAFNTSDGVGGGITASYSATTPYTNTFYSSIIANNSAGFDASTADVFSFGTQTIAGSNSLVMAAGSNITLPGGTLNGDPMLKPLAFNGGPTQTHALDPASPAIDTGLSPISLTLDQRGFARVVGAAADIGAYELDTDRIFSDAFGPLLY